jgi:hypothetical protein
MLPQTAFFEILFLHLVCLYHAVCLNAAMNSSFHDDGITGYKII